MALKSIPKSSVNLAFDRMSSSFVGALPRDVMLGFTGNHNVPEDTT